MGGISLITTTTEISGFDDQVYCINFLYNEFLGNFYIVTYLPAVGDIGHITSSYKNKQSNVTWSVHDSIAYYCCPFDKDMHRTVSFCVTKIK